LHNDLGFLKLVTKHNRIAARALREESVFFGFGATSFLKKLLIEWNEST